MSFSVYDQNGKLKVTVGAIDLSSGASGVTGILPLANGGTNASGAAVTGGVIYSDATKWVATAAGTAGHYLMSSGTSAPTFNRINLASTGVSGILALANGGSNASGAAVTGGVVWSNATQWVPTSAGTAGHYLKSSGTSAPVFSQIDISTTGISGVLPIANGGTNGTAAPTAGGIVYGTGASYAITAAGATGNVLLSNTGAAPTWGKVNLTSGVTGATLTIVSGAGTKARVSSDGTNGWALTSNYDANAGTRDDTGAGATNLQGITGSFSVQFLSATGASSFGLTVQPTVVLLEQGQLKFPATQLASTDVNTLDDYEEGSWTPADGTAAALSFTGVVGRYVKIGKLVIYSGYVEFPVTADASGARIIGLPFTNESLGIWGGAVTYTNANIGTAFNVANFNGTTGVGFFTWTSAQVTNVQLTGKFVTFNGQYRATA